MGKVSILICPLKKLSGQVTPERLGGCCAIISSSSKPDASRIPPIRYVFRQYEDVDAEIPGRSFSEEDGKAIAGFLASLDPQVDTIYCCCDAGESRSPAVAAAVCRYFEQDDSHIWKNPHYHPNMLVFDVLTQMLGVPVSDGEKDLLFYENRNAFHNAILRTR